MSIDVKFWLFITVMFVALVALLLYTADNKPASSKIDGVKIVVIDGCEYIDNMTYPGNSVYTHKGNCTNVIHRR